MNAATTAGMTIRVNDVARRVTPDTTVAAIVHELGFADRKGVAVAVNDAVVPRTNWPTHRLVDGDRVLVIRATQGG